MHAQARIPAFITLALLSCAASRATCIVAPLPSAASRPVAIQLEIIGDKPYVQVRINDSAPLRFIFDTGNPGGFCLDRGRAEMLGLRLDESSQIQLGAGEGTRVRTATARGATVQLGHVTCKDQTLSVFPLAHVAAYEGCVVDGIAGHSFISQFVVELDYAGKQMILHDPRSFEYAGSGNEVPISLRNGYAVARVNLAAPDGERIAGDFIIDSGARAGVILNRPFAEQHHMLERLPKVLRTPIGGGIGGECKGYVGRLERVQIGPFELRRPVVCCSLDRTGMLASSAYAGIIGGPVLRRFRVFLDYQGECMILEPYAQTPETDEFDASGLFILAKRPEVRAYTVTAVIADSPAEEAGLQPGDEIVQVDGRPACELTLETLRNLLKAPDRERRLSVARGTQRIEVTLRLRRLV